MRRIMSLGCIVLLGLCMAVGTLVAATDGVTVVVAKGAPQIMKAGTDAWVPCTVGMAIANGDRIKTAADESVEITFGNAQNIVKVESDSDVFVKKGEPPATIQLMNGSVMAMLNALPKGSTFEVRTPTGIAGCRGTFWRSQAQGPASIFGVYQNSIGVTGIDPLGNSLGAPIIVGEGFKTEVDESGAVGSLERMTDAELEHGNSWRNEVTGRGNGSGGETGGGLLAGSGGVGGSTGGNNTDKLDQVSLEGDRDLDSLESRKEGENDANDIARIEEKLEPKYVAEPESHSTYTGGGYSSSK